MVERPGMQPPASLPPTSIPGSSPAPHGSPEERAEILRYTNEALARFGTAGTLHLRDDRAHLVLPKSQTSAPLGSWSQRWRELDEPTRRLRTTELARSLAQSRAIAASRDSSQKLLWRSRLSLLFWLSGLLGLALWLGSARPWQRGRPHEGSASTRPPAPSAAPSTRSSDERTARATRVCETTRSRVLRGATLGITDIEGWVVEYSAFRTGEQRKLTELPALREFFADPLAQEGTAFIWAQEPGLGDPSHTETRVVLEAESFAATAQTPAISTLRVSFEGTLIDAYFKPEERRRFYHIAHGLTEALGATHSGLYARCKAGKTHHLGSWFFGRSASSATSALLHLLGVHAEPPHLSTALLHPSAEDAVDESSILSRLDQALSPLDRKTLSSLLGKHGGLAMSQPDGSVILTFPFSDGNRASRLSRELSRQLGLSAE